MNVYQQAVAKFRESARLASASAILRAEAASGWGANAANLEDWAEAAEGFTQAVRLLGEVAPRWLARADQESQLAVLKGLGQDAAAACLEAGLPDRAVELLEQGRGVLFAQLLDSRTDLTDLARTNRHLADEFAHLTRELDSPVRVPAHAWQPLTANVSSDLIAQAKVAVDRRRQAAAALEQLLKNIRREKGFETFMLPKPISELLPSAAEGPVVLINVAELRSDALILLPAGVDVLPLPGLDRPSVTGQVEVFLDALYGPCWLISVRR